MPHLKLELTIVLFLQLLWILTPSGRPQPLQSSPVKDGPYTLQIAVDEVSLVFHAFDPNGAPLTTLTAKNIQVSDDGKVQNNILTFESFAELPIRAAFLFDTSASMMDDLAFNRSIIRLYVPRLIRKGADRALVAQFDTETLVTQDWTDDSVRISDGAAAIRMRRDHLPITSLFDSVYTMCRDQWSTRGEGMTGNFMIIFSDGVDDNSHVFPSEAIDECQRSRVAIYAFVNSHKSSFSDGQRTLENLVTKTGGRIFFNPREQQIWEDLKSVEIEQRNEYRLVYKAMGLKHNGDFHRTKIKCLVRGARIVGSSGYYASNRR